MPAPAMTAGMVNTPVPMMLPITSAVAEGRPSARARSVAGDPGVGASGVVVAFVSAIAICVTCLLEPWLGMNSWCSSSDDARAPNRVKGPGQSPTLVKQVWAPEESSCGPGARTGRISDLGRQQRFPKWERRNAELAPAGSRKVGPRPSWTPNGSAPAVRPEMAPRGGVATNRTARHGSIGPGGKSEHHTCCKKWLHIGTDRFPDGNN